MIHTAYPGRRSPPFRPGVMRESTRARPAREKPAACARPIVVHGAKREVKCRPFLKVVKDPTLFAACNALADELGPIDSPKKAYRIIEEAIGDEINEVFGVMTLDIHLRFKGLAETGRGEPSSVMAPLDPTIQTVLMDGAHAVVIFHVHPSGVEAEPSDADRDTTDAFADGFDQVDIRFIDHIIVGGDAKRRSYYSFLEAGDL